MKSLVLLSLAIFTSAAFACTDFSGNYMDELSNNFTITQNACKSLQFISSELTMNIIVDGKEHLVSEFDMSIEGESELTNVKIFATSIFQNEKLVNNIKAVITSPDASVDIQRNWSESFLNENRDMVNVTHFEDGSTITDVDSRVN